MDTGRTQRVTHLDVARLAGVSPAVVSYVINNGPRATSASARERVLRAIQELDYHPHAFARGLRSQRTHTVGFLARDYSPLDLFISPYSAGVLTGLTAELKEHGYYLLVHPLLIGEDLESVATLLRSGRLDGLVVRLVEAEDSANDALLELIASARVPCVCLEQPPHRRFGLDSVLFDSAAGAYAATAYLIRRGHRRIAHLQGDQLYDSARERRRGYEQALQDAGLPIDAELIKGDSWDPATADAAVEALCALAQPPTAIFAANDNLAFRALGILHLAGMRVPDDMALVGFDDIPLAREMVPGLTTMSIPLVEIGRRASRRVLELIESADHRAAARSDVIVPELVVRATA
ncbi:MAG: LacI family DNA-binding transcriptional regulator [Chloroflexi bacterium]|nr:LacI family DNA-binding transcriptional regulator [Chloroflexota bacterium]MBV9131519.1 LacI family DNA-binding transcriptional regulator [Chloroflexota bacterium]MBV9895526.1 LacI family DNA-binding transcriptional regulator [Chloroflexota bacterium]